MPHHPVSCPVCGQVMQKQHIPQGVELDHCPQHGVWLDLGELEAMLEREPPPRRKRSAAQLPAPEPSSALGETVQRAGRQFGQSVVRGAGSTLGRRVMNGVVDAVFGRRR